MEIENATEKMQFVTNPSRHKLYYQLTVLGMLGAMRGLHEDADLIHAVIESKVKNKEQYRVTVVLAQAMGGEVAHAIQSMEARLAANPDDDLAKVVMAAAMFLTGHPDGKFMLDNVMATSIDQPARRAALDMLAFAPVLRIRAKIRGPLSTIRPA